MAVETRSTWALALRIVALGVAAVILLWLLGRLVQVALLVGFAITLAAGLRPLVVRLERLHIPRPAGILLIYIVVIGILGGLATLFVPIAINQAMSLLESAPTYVDDITGWLQGLRDKFPFLPPVGQVQNPLREAIGNLLGQLNLMAQASRVGNILMGIGDALVTVAVLLLTTFFLVNDGDKVRDYFLSFFQPKYRPEGHVITDRIGRRLGGWLIGQVLLSLAVGTLDFIGLTILGVPNAALLAIFAFLTEFIPIVGPFLGGAPALLVALLQSPWKGIATLGLYVLVQQFENHILVPNLLGRAVKLHPLAVVLALTTGAKLFGLLGAVLAVPVAAVGAVLLDEWRDPSRPAREVEQAGSRREEDDRRDAEHAAARREGDDQSEAA